MAASSPIIPDLTGQVALITGASRGIGAATAQAFARAGVAVVLAARDEERLATVARDIVATGGRAIAVPTDVGDPAAVERLVARTLEAFGRLDAAFNNAGAGHMPAPLAEISVEDFDRAQRVNMRGVFLCMKHEIGAMLAGGGGACQVAGVSAPQVRGQTAPGLRGQTAPDHRMHLDSHHPLTVLPGTGSGRTKRPPPPVSGPR